MLRFLKIIRPVKCVIPLYDGYIVQPKEGELHRILRSTSKKSSSKAIEELNPVAWSFDIDQLQVRRAASPQKIKSIRGFQFLWDI